jgi:hypothetical protein
MHRPIRTLILLTPMPSLRVHSMANYDRLAKREPSAPSSSLQRDKEEFQSPSRQRLEIG